MPVIHVGLHRGGVCAFAEALVDSGSSVSIFTDDLAPILGILDIEDGKKIEFAGIDGVVMSGYCHSVDLIVGGEMLHNIDVLFSHELPSDAINILGQHGFFDLFPIRFLQSKGEIDVQLRSRFAKKR